MSNLLRELPHRLQGKEAVLAFDYDGTLSEFADDLQDATVSHGMQRALLQLETVAKIIIVSSRNASFLKERLKFLRSAQIYGLHGLESPQRTKSPLPHAELTSMVSLKRRITAIIEKERHAWIEGKPAGFCVHFRGAKEMAYKKLSALARKAALDAGFRAYGGNWALEVLSKRSPTKASTLQRIARSMGRNGVLFYFGDDDADEEAFAKLGRFKCTITVAIGRKNTAANYSLKDIKELVRVINIITKKIKEKNTAAR
ncbi:MAG: trehalose-phosphatase [Candidatus Micrarchaeota archaeon]